MLKICDGYTPKFGVMSGVRCPGTQISNQKAFHLCQRWFRVFSGVVPREKQTAGPGRKALGAEAVPEQKDNETNYVAEGCYSASW